MARWTKKDKDQVRAILEHAVSKLRGGQAELARLGGIESRSVVNGWAKRGQVPIEYHALVIAQAAPERLVTPGMLHPAARKLEQVQQGLRVASGASA
jgi:hypothetical protein